MSLTLPAGATLATIAPDVSVLTLDHPALYARISLLGGQLLDFRVPNSQPLLYLSPQALFQPGKAIRGGVPVCWPWFGPHPSDASAPAHGVARQQNWALLAVEQAQDVFHVKLQGPRYGELSVQLEYRLAAEGVDIALHSHNHGSSEQTLSSALHTYLAVGDASRVTLSGLEGARCHDKVAQCLTTLPETALGFAGEVDCVVYGSHTVTLHDPAWQRAINIGSAGSASCVIWNPHQEKARRLADLPDDAWRDFVCVETSNAGDDSRQLAAGASHCLRARLRLLSGASGGRV